MDQLPEIYQNLYTTENIEVCYIEGLSEQLLFIYIS